MPLIVPFSGQSSVEKITIPLFSFLTNKNCTNEGEEKIHTQAIYPANYHFWWIDCRSRVLYGVYVESTHVPVRRPGRLRELPHHDSLLSDLVPQFACEVDQLQRLSRTPG